MVQALRAQSAQSPDFPDEVRSARFQVFHEFFERGLVAFVEHHINFRQQFLRTRHRNVPAPRVDGRLPGFFARSQDKINHDAQTQRHGYECTDQIFLSHFLFPFVKNWRVPRHPPSFFRLLIRFCVFRHFQEKAGNIEPELSRIQGIRDLQMVDARRKDPKRRFAFVGTPFGG